MKMIKKVNIGGAYARKEAYEYEGQKFDADIKNGDVVEILNEGEIVSGQYGEQQVFKIKTRNGEKNYPMNQKTINILIDELGEDSKEWVGKEVKVLTQKGIFGGKKSIASYLVSGNWELDEYGDLSKPSEEKNGEEAEEEIPF